MNQKLDFFQNVNNTCSSRTDVNKGMRARVYLKQLKKSDDVCVDLFFIPAMMQLCLNEKPHLVLNNNNEL